MCRGPSVTHSSLMAVHKEGGGEVGEPFSVMASCFTSLYYHPATKINPGFFHKQVNIRVRDAGSPGPEGTWLG